MTRIASKQDPHPTPDGRRWFDPNALMRIKSLQWRAKMVVEGFLGGLHRSPYHGFSVEFSEYRKYSPGDDPRYLDWRVFARSDRYYVKRFEEETNLRCHLVLDMSRSMGFGSRDYPKADYAKTAAATLAYFLTLQRDAVGLLTFDQHVIQVQPPRYRVGQLHRLMLCLEDSVSGTGTDLGPPLEQIASMVKRRGLVVLISDLLAPTERLEKHLGYLTAQGHEVLVVRVLDPAEQEFQFEDPAVYYDLESGAEMYVDPSTTRREYLKRFQTHAAGIERTCATLGIDYTCFTTDRPLERLLLDFLHVRNRRGRRVARNRAPRPGRQVPAQK